MSATTIEGLPGLLARWMGASAVPLRERMRDDAERRRGAHLQAVSTLLLGSLDLEATVQDVWRIMRATLPMRSARCILEADADGNTRSIEWRDARDHAPEDDDVDGGAAAARDGHAAMARGALVWRHTERRDLLQLPLTVGGDALVGSLHIETKKPLAPADIAYAQAVAEQLSIAVHRWRREEQQHATAARRIARVERDRAELSQRWELARDLHERYRALVDNLEDAFVWEADPATLRLLWVSRRAEALIGQSRRDAGARTRELLAWVHEDDRAQAAAHIAEALRSEADRSFVHRLAGDSAARRWFRTGIHCACDAAGVPRLQGVSVDVTHLKRAGERAALLADVGALLSAGRDADLARVLDAVARRAVPLLGDACAVYEVDAAGHLTRVASSTASPGAAGAADGDAIARFVVERRASCAAPAHDGRPPALAAPIVVGDRVIGALAFVGPGLGLGPGPGNGERRRGAPDVALAEDLATRVGAAMENARLHAAEQRAVRAREDLLAIVSHDLKNPLSVMMLHLDALVREVDPMPARAQRQVSAIARAADQMGRLIHDLLDGAQMDAGRFCVAPVPTPPGALLDHAIAELAARAQRREIAMQIDVDGSLPPVLADPPRIQQVFENLVGNAIKALGRGGTITLRARSAGAFVELAVEDSAMGIPSADLPHLFDRYWQAEGRTRRDGKGLGLFIVKGIVESHGGAVRVESTVGCGTVFSFTLPIAPPASSAPSAAPST